LIATNTTLGRDGLAAADRTRAGEAGGLSGRPAAARAREVVACSRTKETGGALPIIGVGGIGTPADALAMIDAGASLVQVYSALIFHGPGMIRKINRAARVNPYTCDWSFYGHLRRSPAGMPWTPVDRSVSGSTRTRS